MGEIWNMIMGNFKEDLKKNLNKGEPAVTYQPPPMAHVIGVTNITASLPPNRTPEIAVYFTCNFMPDYPQCYQTFAECVMAVGLMVQDPDKAMDEARQLVAQMVEQERSAHGISD